MKPRFEVYCTSTGEVLHSNLSLAEAKAICLEGNADKLDNLYEFRLSR